MSNNGNLNTLMNPRFSKMNKRNRYSLWIGTNKSNPDSSVVVDYTSVMMDSMKNSYFCFKRKDMKIHEIKLDHAHGSKKLGFTFHSAPVCIIDDDGQGSHDNHAVTVIQIQKKSLAEAAGLQCGDIFFHEDNGREQGKMMTLKYFQFALKQMPKTFSTTFHVGRFPILENSGQLPSNESNGTTNGTKLSEINKENGKEILLNFSGGEQKHIEIDVDVKDGNTALISSKSNIELPKQGKKDADLHDNSSSSNEDAIPHRNGSAEHVNKEHGKEILLNFSGGEPKPIENDVEVKDGNTSLNSSRSNTELPKQGGKDADLHDNSSSLNEDPIPYSYGSAEHVKLLLRCQRRYGWKDDYSQKVFEAYFQFMSLKILHKDKKGSKLSPPFEAVDQMWREHILDIDDYQKFCIIYTEDNWDEADIIHFYDPDDNGETDLNYDCQMTRQALTDHYGDVYCEVEQWIKNNSPNKELQISIDSDRFSSKKRKLVTMSNEPIQKIVHNANGSHVDKNSISGKSSEITIQNDKGQQPSESNVLRIGVCLPDYYSKDNETIIYKLEGTCMFNELVNDLSMKTGYNSNLIILRDSKGKIFDWSNNEKMIIEHGVKSDDVIYLGVKSDDVIYLDVKKY